VEVASSRPATLGEWQAAFGLSGATFFHGPLWAQIWQEYSRGVVVPAPRKIEFSDGQSAVIGAVRVPTRLPYVRQLVLSPEGNCGGWVSGDQLTPVHKQALAREVLREPAVIWRRHPLDRLSDGLTVEGERLETTHLIDLGAGAGAAHERWRAGARGAVAHARRAGVTVRNARRIEDWVSYYALYERIARLRGWTFIYDQSLFLLLAEVGEPLVELWLAELEGRVIGGSVNFVHREHVVAWHATSDRTHCAGVANLLDWEMIDLYADRGSTVFDLNGSGGHQGVVRYKESVGAVAMPVRAVVRRHPVEESVRTLARMLRLRRPLASRRAAVAA